VSWPRAFICCASPCCSRNVVWGVTLTAACVDVGSIRRRRKHILDVPVSTAQRFNSLPVPAAVDDTELNLGEKKKKKKKKVVLEDAVSYRFRQQ
jgi:hypothetical protein